MYSGAPYELNPTNYWFPEVDLALKDPNGLLAVGGDLKPKRLLAGYKLGIFPWYSSGEPIFWWSPDPRIIIIPNELKVSRSLTKSIRNKGYKVTYDQAFEQVLQGCANRITSEGTWITARMAHAYKELFKLGHAHSIETWHEDQLIGGLYGVTIGKIFFGESMFSLKADASKVALANLCKKLSESNYSLLDCQVPSQHLMKLGGKFIPRAEFVQIIAAECEKSPENIF